MKRACVWRQHERGCVQNADEVPQAAVERGEVRVAAGLEYDPLGPALALGAAADQHRLQPVVRVQRVAHFGPALDSGLRNLVGILDASALVLTPDTGPLHIGVALDRPVISLMGYTNPQRSGPYRKFHDLIVDGFADPGERYDASAKNRPGRMGRIVPRDVLDKVDVWKARYSAASLSSPPKR